MQQSRNFSERYFLKHIESTIFIKYKYNVCNKCVVQYNMHSQESFYYMRNKFNLFYEFNLKQLNLNKILNIINNTNKII